MGHIKPRSTFDISSDFPKIIYLESYIGSLHSFNVNDYRYNLDDYNFHL
jgi:hypothetical protein